jgi:hypothetical protein
VSTFSEFIQNQARIRYRLPHPRDYSTPEIITVVGLERCPEGLKPNNVTADQKLTVNNPVNNIVVEVYIFGINLESGPDYV